MLGPVIIVVVLLVVLPISFLVGGAAFAALFGHLMRTTAERDHEGSELIELNQ